MTSNQPWWLTMPVRELAATILPLLSSSAYVYEARATHGIVSWCRTGSYREPMVFMMSRGGPFDDPDTYVVAEAMQVLERAGLLMRGKGASWEDLGPVVGLTRLGRHALATNIVRQHLGISDAAPTA
jgi:hypothetical protein